MAIDSMKLIRHLDNLRDEKPITADIFLTNYCNNNCPYCTYHRWELEPGSRYMKFEDFVRYVTKMRALGVKGVILTGGGEPTINPDFEGITRWLESSGIKYGLNTNFNKYVECSPSFLKVSLDGYSERSYKRRRGVDAYNKVIENIHKYCEFRDKSRTSLGVQIVVTNFDEIDLFYDATKNLDVDFIVFRPIEATGGYYTQNDIAGVVQSMMNAINRLKLKDNRVVLNSKWYQLSTCFGKCSAQWAQLAIDERGNVMYCCQKPYEIVGHVMDNDILDKKRAFKTDMSKCDIPCRMTASNIIADYLVKPMKDGEFI